MGVLERTESELLHRVAGSYVEVFFFLSSQALPVYGCSMREEEVLDSFI